jgi:hypothetical protein
MERMPVIRVKTRKGIKYIRVGRIVIRGSAIIKSMLGLPVKGRYSKKRRKKA